MEVLRDGDIAGWEEKVFAGKTRYETVRQDGRAVVRATSRGTASGLYLRRRIDLEKTPVLRWTWRVEGTLGDIDERTRAGDDYAARVYVIRSHPVFLWRTRAVNYVWASTRAPGETWPNAYTDASRNVAVRSGEEDAGRWVEERRDVRADFRDAVRRVRPPGRRGGDHDRHRQHRRRRGGVLRRHHLHERVSVGREPHAVLRTQRSPKRAPVRARGFAIRDGRGRRPAVRRRARPCASSG